MISEELLERLVAAASRAPSADNMQAWSFTRAGDAINAYLAPSRVLPTDVNAMFAWVGLGAAIENLVIAAEEEGFSTAIDYAAFPANAARGGAGALGARESEPSSQALSRSETPVTVRLSPIEASNPLARWIERRETNRGPYDPAPLDPATLDELTRAAGELDAGVHWATGPANLNLIASMDARSTYIRLEHQPLHDELFDVLRFSRRARERTRFGLDFESLGIPHALVWLARLLRYQPVMKVVSRLGIGRFIARQLAARLRSAGAVCLVTARGDEPAAYIEAGRVMERLWLAATARGLAVQPHGVLPQYLTKLEIEPDGLLPVHAEVMRGHREPFGALFPGARDEHPAIVLRVGRPRGRPSRRSVRLPVNRLIRE